MDPALTGRRVELRYDPEDLTVIEVFLDGKPAGAATPFITHRHVHRAIPQAARPRRPPPASTTWAWSPPPTKEAAGTGAKIDFTAVGRLTAGEPGQQQGQEQGQVIYIANPAFGTRGLYVTIVRAPGAQPRYLKAELMAQASDLLAAETGLDQQWSGQWR